MFKRNKNTATLAGVALATVALGSGVALASSATAATVPSAGQRVVSTTGDGDNIQSGDQSSTDTAGTASESASPTEVTGATAEVGSPETGTASDGLGGHADPVGNVDHQFNGNE